jgi:hypothetical protein
MGGNRTLVLLMVVRIYSPRERPLDYKGPLVNIFINYINILYLKWVDISRHN